MAESDRGRNADGVAIVALCPSLGEDHFGGTAHATIVFCGTVDDVSLAEAMKIDSLTRVMSIMQFKRFRVPVIGEDMFGVDNNERVLLLPEQGTPFTSMRMRCAYLNKSRFTQYRPHVATTETVESIEFVGLAFWYGTKRITYPFPIAEVEDADGPGSVGDDQGGGDGTPP